MGKHAELIRNHSFNVLPPPSPNRAASTDFGMGGTGPPPHRADYVYVTSKKNPSTSVIGMTVEMWIKKETDPRDHHPH